MGNFYLKLIQDLSALGGLPFYIFFCVVFALIGFFDLTLQLILGLVFAYSTIVISRLVYFRERPQKEKYNNILEKIDSSSFPSMHSLRIIIFSALTSLYFNILPLSLFLFVLSLGVILTRLYLKKHYVSDVLAGAVFGILESVIIYYIFISL
jgi:membrane-associated phospholipid phosphatase